MNNFMPYISSDPPPIKDDSFETEMYNSETCNPYEINNSIDSSKMQNEEMEIEEYVDDNVNSNEETFQYQNYGRDNDLTGIRTQIQLSEYIDKVVQENNLGLDITDSVVSNNIDYNEDNISEHSVDGQFDQYIDTIYNVKNDKIPDDSVSNTVDHDIQDVVNNINQYQSYEDLNCDKLTKKCSDLKIDEFREYPPVSTESASHIDYFFNKSAANIKHSDLSPNDFADFSFINETVENFVPSQTEYSNSNITTKEVNSVDTDIINSEKSPAEFGDFSFVNETVDDVASFRMENSIAKDYADGDMNSINDFDDDFEDFATFEDFPAVLSNTVVANPGICIESSDKSVESLVANLLANLGSKDSDGIISKHISDFSHIIRPDSFISNQKLFNDLGSALWKELTNYDYSPAFVFQWMQSATFERFISVIGPEYKEMLSSHRATLPLYSVNLIPIEPIPVESCNLGNVSSSSSNIDLTAKDCSSISMPEKNSIIDFKNLEEEFIFNQFPNSAASDDTKSADVSSSEKPSSLFVSSNESPTVIQSDRFGSIFKSILKPLNATKSSVGKSINPQTEAILKELPDLSYMSSKVLMFPVISTCDVEENI